MTPRNPTLDGLMEVRIGLESHGVVLAAERADYKVVFRLTVAPDRSDCAGPAGYGINFF